MSLSFGEKIKDARKSKNLTQKQLAEKIGAKHNSISDWENDKNKPDPDAIELLCGLLEITPNYLLAASPDEFSPAEKLLINRFKELDTYGQENVNITIEREEERIRMINAASIFKNRNITPIRIYSYMHKIGCAGNGFYFDDIPIDTIEAPYMEDADFIIGVNGDSMEPTFHDGDKIYVERRQIIEIGEIGVFVFNNECYVKEAGEKGLISHNHKYPQIPGNESMQCIGKVLGKVFEIESGNEDAIVLSTDDMAALRLGEQLLASKKSFKIKSI